MYSPSKRLTEVVSSFLGRFCENVDSDHLQVRPQSPRPQISELVSSGAPVVDRTGGTMARGPRAAKLEIASGCVGEAVAFLPVMGA
jgi:hypothetical protein